MVRGVKWLVVLGSCKVQVKGYGWGYRATVRTRVRARTIVLELRKNIALGSKILGDMYTIHCDT